MSNTITGISPSSLPTAPRTSDAKTPEEAARQFEEVLVKQFVRTMTKDIFSGSLGGDDTPSWVKTQGESQADTLADEVTRHLVDQGTLGIADMLLRQWTVSESMTTPGEAFPLQKDLSPMPLGGSNPIGLRPLQAPTEIPTAREAFGLAPRPDPAGIDLSPQPLPPSSDQR